MHLVNWKFSLLDIDDYKKQATIIQFDVLYATNKIPKFVSIHFNLGNLISTTYGNANRNGGFWLFLVFLPMAEGK